ncbi:MAG TPA: aspartyl protease family protein [Pyrinomonadaceae bacterium]|nr:aspartyl protease family protein [Pyrinomonadaceae bacterium]
MKRSALSAASAFLIALTIATWAASSSGAARWRFQKERGAGRVEELFNNGPAALEKGGRASSRSLPRAVRFREVGGRGLLVKAWVNEEGPYTFAIDTGAGATILSQRVARQAGVAVKSGRALELGGLSGLSVVAGHEAVVRRLALGDRGNLLPAKGSVIVTDRLPPDVDGVLDPTESYWPLGYSIDMPNGVMSAFDPRLTPLRVDGAPSGGTVVPWLMDGSSRRPFVRLDDNRRALLDTGSGFGLAVSADVARAIGVVSGEGKEKGSVRDLAGGRIAARRVTPATVRIGSLVLRRVPTDLLSGVEAGSPILLGRDALQPFRLTFDPVNRLIQFAPN